MTIPQQIIQEMREEFIKEFDDWKTSELHRMSDWWIAKYISLLKSLRAEIPEHIKQPQTTFSKDVIDEYLWHETNGKNSANATHRTKLDELINLLEK